MTFWITVVVLLVVILFLLSSLFGFLITQVPYVPTPKGVIDAMVTRANLKGHETVYDLGAGDGRILIEAKRRHPGIKAIGCELVPAVWMLGMMLKWFSRVDIDFRLGDAHKVDVSDADCIFLYLIPHMLGGFEEQFDRELKPGTLVLSHSFKFPRRKPIESFSATGFFGISRATVHVYKW